jgi:hypothetical protein
MCLGKEGDACSISVVGGTSRRQVFSLKCLVEYIRHACGPLPKGVLTRQGLCFFLSCSKHIVKGWKSRLPCHVCNATESTQFWRQTVLELSVSDYLTKNYRKTGKRNANRQQMYFVCIYKPLSLCSNDQN